MSSGTFILKRHQDFVEQAAHAESMARSVSDPSLQDSWRECAASWYYMAERCIELNHLSDARAPFASPASDRTN